MVDISLPMILGVVSGVSVLFWTRTKIAAALFSIVDLIVGLLIIGTASTVNLLSYAIPETVILYLGVAITIKGIYYLVLSFR